MPDLTTTYLGLTLKNPLVASASPLSKKLDSARQLDEAGIGAIVMHSLFEEQIIHESLELDHYLNQGTDSFAEALSYFPDVGTYAIGPGKYLDHVSAVKKAVSVPVIASLNGVSKGGWTRYAHFMEEAGADALELNLYYLATDPTLSGAQLEKAYIELVGQVRAAVRIPLAVKLSPFVTALPDFARRLVAAGADGLQPGSEHFIRYASAFALDLDPVREYQRRFCPDYGRPHPPGCAQGPDGWGKGDDAGLRIAQERHCARPCPPR